MAYKFGTVVNHVNNSNCNGVMTLAVLSSKAKFTTFGNVIHCQYFISKKERADRVKIAAAFIMGTNPNIAQIHDHNTQ